jgi:hypothetical protein
MSRPGDQFKADVAPGFLDEVSAGYEKAGRHLWITNAIYGLTDEEAAHATEGITIYLDRPHLLHVTIVGCFLCEKPYEEAVKDERCKGNPVRYEGPSGRPVYADGTRG